MPYNPNAIWDSKNPKSPAGGIIEPPVTGIPARVGKEVDISKQSRPKCLVWVGVGVLFLMFGGFFAYRFLVPTALPSAAIVISVPDSVFIGDPFDVGVEVKNTSDVILKNVKLDLTLPAGISAVGEAQGQTFASFSIGDVATGTAVTQTSTLIATSGSGNVVSLAAQAAYGGNSAPAQFHAGSSANIMLGGSAVGLSVSVPASAVAGSPVPIALTYANETPDVIRNVDIALDAPPAFNFVTSSMAATSGTVWHIGTVVPHATGTVTVFGNLTSAAEATYGFTGLVKVTEGGESYEITGPAVNIALHQTPLSLAIGSNGSPGFFTAPNDFLTYTIHYANHSGAALQGATVRAALTGSMFDFSTVASAGSFDSRTDTVTWSLASSPALASIAPGAAGNLTIRVRTLSDFPIHREDDKNFSLRIDGSIVTPTVLPGVAATSTVGTASLVTKVGGSAAVYSRGFRYDDTFGITNTGPYPPIVNRETQYSIHWTVTDTSDELRNVVIAATLPTGITFIGKATSTVSTAPQFNPATGMVSWSVPSIPATAGIALMPPQAVFQVAATPASNQVGQSISLLGKTTLQAADVFTGLPLAATADDVSTDLPNDPVAKQVRNNTVQGN
jgi:hypothetical protein